MVGMGAEAQIVSFDRLQALFMVYKKKKKKKKVYNVLTLIPHT